jgi:hypothetical protein
MARDDTGARVAQYVQQLLDNRYAQENLSDGLEAARSAYRRATKRRVEPTRDEKLRRKVQEAARSLGEAASAIRTGRSKPRPRWGRRMLVVIGVGAVGIAAALAAGQEADE